MLRTPPPRRRLTFSLFARSSNSWTSEGGFAILNVSSSASVFLSQVVTSLISEFSCCKSCFTLSFLRSSCACSSSHLSKAPGVKSSSQAPISLPPAQTCRGCPLPEASLSWRWTGPFPLLWCKGCATTPTKAWGGALQVGDPACGQYACWSQVQQFSSCCFQGTFSFGL